MTMLSMAEWKKEYETAWEAAKAHFGAASVRHIFLQDMNLFDEFVRVGYGTSVIAFDVNDKGEFVKGEYEFLEDEHYGIDIETLVTKCRWMAEYKQMPVPI